MSTIAMSGDDTIIIDNELMVDLADGNVGEITFPNDIAQVKTGKNRNSIYGLNTTGFQCEMKLRIIRGSGNDISLNSKLNNQNNNFAGFILMQGQFVKKLGDGQGNIKGDTYILSGGVFTKQVEAQSNVEGDATQSVAVYQMKFTYSPRSIR